MRGEMENSMVFAVPCDQAVVVSKEKGEEILAKIKERRSIKVDRAKLEQDVKRIFTKPSER